MGCEHAQAAGGQTSPSQFEENTLSEVKRVIAVLSGKGRCRQVVCHRRHRHRACPSRPQRSASSMPTSPASIPKMFGMSGRHVHALWQPYAARNLRARRQGHELQPAAQNETDPVLWRGPVIAGAIRQFWSETSWGPIDYLLVDMPPGTGDVALTVFQSLPVDGIAIVTSPQDLVSMMRRQGGQHGREDERPHSGHCREHELY